MGYRKGFIITVLFCYLGLSQCYPTKYPYGQRLYENLCADCHMEDGSGLTSLYPSMKTESLIENYEIIPCYIRSGSKDSTKVLKMLPMKNVSEAEITNIINYILNDLNKVDVTVGIQEIKQLLSDCHLIVQ